MVTFISILSMIGLVIAGFLLAEFLAAFLDKQENKTKVYFSFIGVTFTQKDAQRLGLAFLVGLGVFLLESVLVKLTGYTESIYLAYFLTGISPTAVLHFVEKKAKDKMGIKDKDFDVAGIGDDLPPPEEEEEPVG